MEKEKTVKPIKDPDLLGLLKQTFGFDSFRPLQEEIIRHALAGEDVFALLPTGGGKSLCYQLPALARPGLTVVVSPLIALMKDQVDALTASGVPATFLNSSLESSESRRRLRDLHQNRMQLLYVAPERLMLSGFLEDLARWNVGLIAVDEAHCISEWGHDFRPEYRRLADLRDRFPELPMMALTATATRRVREDIVRLLKLRDPREFVASFNRPNLTYRVQPKIKAYPQLLDFVRRHPRESGIVYVQARQAAERLAGRLSADGILARPYHAGLSAEERTRHQDLFLKDEIHVICATIAFGMGINKPDVRYVVHYDLPKNIEGYYQETGRAGRDGLPADCLLLFSAGDAIKQSRFIEEKTDPQEKQVAKTQLNQMIHYAETALCRRAALLQYFNEAWSEPSCGACDNCLSPPETYDGTVAGQKFLSCVYRIRQKSGFGVGLQHVVEVLTGAETEKIRKWGHQHLSTYGIGEEHDRKEWAAVGRELIRLGFLTQNAEKFNVLELTPQARKALSNRDTIRLVRRVRPVAAAKPQAGRITCDEELFASLRQLRKKLADQLGVPPYIVLSDVSLRQMARHYPTRKVELLSISGIGKRKLQDYGETFLAAIRSFLETHPRQIFAEDV